jgi:hypothetical protein
MPLRHQFTPYRHWRRLTSLSIVTSNLGKTSEDGKPTGEVLSADRIQMGRRLMKTLSRRSAISLALAAPLLTAKWRPAAAAALPDY